MTVEHIPADSRAVRKAINKRRYWRHFCFVYWQRLGGFDSFMAKARTTARKRMAGLRVE